MSYAEQEGELSARARRAGFARGLILGLVVATVAVIALGGPVWRPASPDGEPTELKLLEPLSRVRAWAEARVIVGRILTRLEEWGGRGLAVGRGEYRELVGWVRELEELLDAPLKAGP
jgi:hypothetical protein